MVNSLVIANSVEVLSGGVPSTLALGAGATYHLSPGWDLSSPQPVIDFTGSTMNDGSRPYGRRADNRTITLPITIVAPDLSTLAGAREALLQLIDQDIWTLTWVRDSGPGQLVFDCFRAKPSVIAYSLPVQNALISQLSITFDALPYPRSTTQQQVAFPVPLPGSPPPPPAPLVLDQFFTISSGPMWTQSRACIVGPASGCWDPALGGYPDGSGQVLVYSNPFTSPQNITGLTGLSFWLGLGSRHWWNHEYQGRTKVTISVVMTDTFGSQLKFWLNKRLHVANSVTSPSWAFISTAIPQGSTGFSYASVASMSITVTNRANPPQCRYLVVFLDNVTAYPPARVPVAPSPKGNVHILSGVQGTTHAPISLQAQGPAVPGTPTTVTAAGVGAYTVPANTVFLRVEAWGAGGAGAGETGSGVGGGGGGGEYAQEPVFLATPGQVVPYNVGAGGTQGAAPVSGQGTVFGPAPGGLMIVGANGGQSAAQNSITGAAGGAGSTNAIHFPGGLGRTASGSVGGGGGGSAGPGAPGATPMGSASVVLTGASNWTVPAGVTQVTVTAIGPGGGGGSGSNAGNNGGGGGGGESATQTFAVTPGAVIPYACGTGGAGGAASGLPGSAGSASTTFGPVSGTTLTAHAGAGGPSNSHSVTPAAGGSGSAAPIHFNGGTGGGTSPYSGSGGSSAGTSAQGNAGSSYSSGGASAPAGGGAGGNSAGTGNGSGSAGQLPGGGGGGSYVSSTTGGTGGNGQIVVSYPGGAPTNNGAAAVTGGGAGGAGGPSANTAGSAGSAPGGGGGGADSTGTPVAGGAGGAGKLIITPYQLAAFKTLIAHRPGPDSPPSFVPLVSVGNGADTPNGGTEYAVPPVLPAPPLNINSQFVSDVSNWTAVNNAALSWSQVWLPAGSGLFSGNGATANPNMISEKTVAVVPGTKYTGSVLLYSPQGFATCQAIITWYDSAGALLSTSASSSTNVPAGATAGTLVSVANATAPATAAYASLTVQMTGTPANTVLMYVDLAQIVNPLAVVNARFNGTYSVVLTAVTPMASPSSSHTVTVTVKQYEASGGPSSSTSTQVTFVPNGSGAQPAIKNGIVVCGEVTLPWKDIPSNNATALFTITVSDTITATRYYDCLLLDAAGQTLVINEPATGYVTYYADEPDPHTLLGRHLGSSAGRGSAVSVLDACDSIGGGALTVEPGDNVLLTYSVEGAPSIGITYFPHFFIDRPY